MTGERRALIVATDEYSDPKLAQARVHQELNDFQDFPELPRTAPT